MSKPDNLPYGWEYQEATDSVICGGCAFRFGAEHCNGDGSWSCPCCGDGATREVIDAQMMLLRRHRAKTV
jgi:phage/plasmid primase-like uncharacterized protein